MLPHINHHFLVAFDVSKGGCAMHAFHIGPRKIRCIWFLGYLKIRTLAICACIEPLTYLQGASSTFASLQKPFLLTRLQLQLSAADDKGSSL